MKETALRSEDGQEEKGQTGMQSMVGLAASRFLVGLS